MFSGGRHCVCSYQRGVRQNVHSSLGPTVRAMFEAFPLVCERQSELCRDSKPTIPSLVAS